MYNFGVTPLTPLERKILGVRLQCRYDYLCHVWWKNERTQERGKYTGLN
jgi:hypothetical protein